MRETDVNKTRAARSGPGLSLLRSGRCRVRLARGCNLTLEPWQPPQPTGQVPVQSPSSFIDAGSDLVYEVAVTAPPCDTVVRRRFTLAIVALAWRGHIGTET